MDDTFILSPMTLIPADNTLPFNIIDELNSSDRYWLREESEDYTIVEQPMSTLFSLDISSDCLFTCSGNKIDNTLLNPPKEEISYGCTKTRTSLSVKTRLKMAFENLKEFTRDRDILIQTWMPVKRGGKCVLTTNNQPFSLSPNSKSLEYYRDVSTKFQFSAEENIDKEEKHDFVSRVFLDKLPEWTPDVKFFREDEYVRVTHAQQLDICGSCLLPFFKRDEASCVGVIEIVTTTQKVNYHPELEGVYKALEAVDLRSYDVLGPHMIKTHDDGSYQAALAEIQEILKFVCDEHGLPLAQTWAPCIQQGKPGIRHSEENYMHCVSTVDSACYMPHAQLLGFHEASSEHHLLRGQGLAGEAFMTNQPCFASDISAFSKTNEYPLCHHARMFGLHASIAVRLRSIYTGSAADFVLEFILPIECQDTQQQSHMLNSISCSIQQVCRSLRTVTDQELLEETSLKRNFTSPSPCSTFAQAENNRRFAYSERSCSEEEESSWISYTMEAQRESIPIMVPLGYLQEDLEGEFKLTTHWDEDDGTETRYMPEITRKDQILHNLGVKTSYEYNGDIFSVDGYCKPGGRKPSQKRRTKPEKTITLQVLRPYFAGSLKDAAQSIGVCPTTLKRICRQHGITRWPSRKIKKVEHSLRKLQHVIDSVQGVEDAFQLSSLYSSISTNKDSEQTSPPQINDLFVSSTKLNDQLKRQFTTQTPKYNLSNDVTCQDRIDLPTMVHVGRLMKLKVTFGEERIRFSMQPHWDFNDLLNEIGKRFNLAEYWHSSRIEIKYLDDDSEWVLLQCDADLDECLQVHNSCGSSMIKLMVHLGLSSLPHCTAST